MLDYNKHLSPLEGDGVTDEQIAGKLLACGLTMYALPIHKLRRFLDDAGLLMRDADNRWVGPLANRVRAAADGPPDEVSRGLMSLLGQLGDPRAETIDTHKDGERVARVMDALVAESCITPEQRQAVYDLAGGLVHADVTAEAVAAERARHMQGLAVASVRNVANNAMTATLGSEDWSKQSMIEAVVAALSDPANF